MKKSQSIFLLSGLVPLVAAPIAIVASCSNDTTATTTFSLKGAEVTLAGLTDEQKELNQYVSDTAKLSQLIVAKKAEIFNNPPADLAASQVEIVGAVTPDTTAGSLSFKLKVKSTANPPTDLIAETGLVLKGFATAQTGQQAYTITLAKTDGQYSATEVPAVAQKPISEITDDASVKAFVIANKDKFFTFKANEVANFNWETNLTITQTNVDSGQKSVTFTLTLNNSTNAGGKIENQQITVTGFAEATPPAVQPYTITLTKTNGQYSATEVPAVAQKPISEITDDASVKAFVIANKDKFFTFKANEVTNFNWETNLTITQTNVDSGQKSVTFTLTLNNSTNAGGKIENQQITVTGFQ